MQTRVSKRAVPRFYLEHKEYYWMTTDKINQTVKKNLHVNMTICVSSIKRNEHKIE